MRAARLITASDEPPNQIGIGRCTGTGNRFTASSLWKRPSKLTRSSVHSLRITAICSAWRAPRVLQSMKRASYSTWFHPTPTPSRSRPPLRISTSAACLATTPVCRWGRMSTPLHSLIVVVTAAIKAKVVKVSWNGSFSLYIGFQSPRGAAPKTWSATSMQL